MILALSHPDVSWAAVNEGLTGAGRSTSKLADPHSCHQRPLFLGLWASTQGFLSFFTTWSLDFFKNMISVKKEKTIIQVNFHEKKRGRERIGLKELKMKIGIYKRKKKCVLKFEQKKCLTKKPNLNFLLLLLLLILMCIVNFERRNIFCRYC